MAQTFGQVVEHALLKLIEFELSTKIERIISGTGVKDFETYKGLIGEISGLRKAVILLDEAKDVAEGRRSIEVQ